MFQPRVKLEFVRRHCAPKDGCCVYVDIDPSEEGRTGSKRESDSSRKRQFEMQADAPRVREELRRLGVDVGSRKRWCERQGLPYLEGDPDIVGYDRANRRCVVAEVEGASSGQPEQKLYKAIGQIVRTASLCLMDGDTISWSSSMGPETDEESLRPGVAILRTKEIEMPSQRTADGASALR